MISKESVLKEYFGYSVFRNGQEKVVDNILSGRDLLCVMPTGAGKSVCYQIPALMFDGVTVVVSPLISLMKDQVSALKQNGVAGAYLNSSLTFNQYLKALHNVSLGVYKIIYVAPERLDSDDFLKAISGIKISLIAVDEAHCISQWGQNFRPSYLRITDFIDRLGYRPTVAAFTATATEKVKDDILNLLKLNNPFQITTGFDRPNLKFGIIRPNSKIEELKKILEKHKNECGIVYCSTRKAVEDVCDKLNAAGFSAAMYHAGLDDDIRKQNQDDFVNDRVNVMVATNAFGMGIDKSNVSFVIHYNMPKDLESYYQEAGRAGRDGSPAECILLYNAKDVHTIRFLIENSEQNSELTEEELEAIRKREYEKLKLMTFYCTTDECLRHYILSYFGETSPNYCGNCSNCIGNFTETDITVDAQKILSCIRRSGEKFGKKTVCDILKGSRSEKLKRLGLDRQSTYGLMREYKEWQIREIVDFLETNGYIFSTDGDYPIICTTSKADGILFGNEKLSMKQRKVKKEKTYSGNKNYNDLPINQELLDELKALRRKIANSKGVPAFVIFSDATLIDMCKRHPKTEKEFMEVSGVGRTKLEQYGEKFLEVLNRIE